MEPHSCESGKFWYVFQLMIYVWVHISHFISLLSICLDKSYWTAWMLVLHFTVAYIFEQNAFLLVHWNVHARCIEQFGTLIHCPDDVNYGMYVAWYHHYVDQNIFIPRWLQYRCAYFDFWYTFIHFFINGMFPVSFVLMCYQFFCFGHVNTLLIDIQLALFWRHVQGVVHEWYHVSIVDRPSYFHIPVWFYFLSLMEYSGVISTCDHHRHHEHDYLSLTGVDFFCDMWVPCFWNFVVSKLWKLHIIYSEAAELVGSSELFIDEKDRAGSLRLKFSLWYMMKNTFRVILFANYSLFLLFCFRV